MLEEIIKNYLIALGFNNKKRGFCYLQELIKMGCDGNIEPLNNNGYIKLAEKYGTRPNTVEKDIQYLISVTFQEGNPDILYEEFGESIDPDKGKPTNKHFIFNTIEKLKYYA